VLCCAACGTRVGSEIGFRHHRLYHHGLGTALIFGGWDFAEIPRLGPY
jgi:hypothetical protein